MKPLELRKEGSRVVLLPVIKGLKSESREVLAAYELARPDRIAVSLSKEELEGLRNIPADYSPELSRYEEIYARELQRFGDVASPPPCYVAVLEISEHYGIPLVPVDLEEDDYSRMYSAAVSGTDLFRHSTRVWWLKRRKFKATTAEGFVHEWDDIVNELPGFAALEKQRTKAMVKGILSEIKQSKSILAVIELERAEDVADSLERELGKEGGKQ